jgi:hypothetical protein
VVTNHFQSEKDNKHYTYLLIEASMTHVRSCSGRTGPKLGRSLSIDSKECYMQCWAQLSQNFTFFNLFCCETEPRGLVASGLRGSLVTGIVASNPVQDMAVLCCLLVITLEDGECNHVCKLPRT